MLSLLPDDEQKSSWGFSQPLVQGGAPYLAKLMYNNVHYGFCLKKQLRVYKATSNSGGFNQPLVAGGVFFPDPTVTLAPCGITELRLLGEIPTRPNCTLIRACWSLDLARDGWFP